MSMSKVHTSLLYYVGVAVYNVYEKPKIGGEPRRARVWSDIE